MRTVGSLAMAIVGLMAFSNTTDTLVRALTHPQPSESFLEIAFWSIMAAIAFFFAVAVRGATWAIVLPGVMATLLMAFLAFIGEPHGWIVAASTLGLTMLLAGLSRAHNARLFGQIGRSRFYRRATNRKR